MAKAEYLARANGIVNGTRLTSQPWIVRVLVINIKLGIFSSAASVLQLREVLRIYFTFRHLESVRGRRVAARVIKNMRMALAGNAVYCRTFGNVMDVVCDTQPWSWNIHAYILIRSSPQLWRWGNIISSRRGTCCLCDWNYFAFVRLGPCSRVYCYKLAAIH